MRESSFIEYSLKRFFNPVIISHEANNGTVEYQENGSEDSEAVSFSMVKPHDEASPELVFDLGRKSTGFLIFDILKSENTNVIIEYGPTLDSMYFSAEFTIPQYVENQRLVMDEFLAMRFFRIKLSEHGILPNNANFQVRSVMLKNSAYPIDGRRRFESSLPRLNDIWDIGVYTTQVCLQRHDLSFCYREFLSDKQKFFLENWKNPYSPYVIWDGPRRDREVWIGDVRTEALTTLYSMNVPGVVKSSLEVFADLQFKDGNIPASATSRQMFTEYTFWWVITLAEYLRYSDDREYYQHVAHAFYDILGWIDQKMFQRDFIEVENTWMWTLGLHGKVGEAQCVLYRCYREIAWIDNQFGEGMLEQKYSRLAEELRQRINETFWDDEIGAYRDRFFTEEENNNLVFLDLNTYAITLGVADEAYAQRALSYIKEHMWTDFGTKTYVGSRTPAPDRWGHDDTVWPFIVGYELESLFQYDRSEDAFELIESCWGSMIDQGATTYWEFKDDKGEFPTRSMIKNPIGDNMCSYSHGWSGWVSYLMQRYICGIQPAATGLKSVMLDPHLGSLESCSGRAETSLGPLTVSYSQEGKNLRIEAEVPVGLKLSLRSDYLEGLYENVSFNGEAVDLGATTSIELADHPKRMFPVVPLHS